MSLNNQLNTLIPTRMVGPLTLKGEMNGTFSVPLATYEIPLWASVRRGAKVTSQNGIYVTLINEIMTRSILCEGQNAHQVHTILNRLNHYQPQMEEIIATTSRFLRLVSWHGEIVGNLLFIRFAFKTEGAAGHNMVTKGAQALQNWLTASFDLKYVSISGNYCVDKKNSAVNGILGRGRSVIAETWLSKDRCCQLLKATPEQIVALNTKKNFIGSMLSGSVRSANAHYANMLLAFYLAIGQDGANIVEGSQGITYAEIRNEDLYFSVNLPNIIVGSIGNGKNLPHVQQAFNLMHCFTEDATHNSRCLAYLAAATVLCGELSLLAAQVNPNELIKSHLLLERKSK